MKTAKGSMPRVGELGQGLGRQWFENEGERGLGAALVSHSINPYEVRGEL
jgi:hypothetical protein